VSAELLVELAAAGLAIWAAILSLPRPPTLDWQRLFKVSLATLLRGELEASDGEREEWEASVAALVLYHPAGRDPEQKLTDPDPATLLTPALPGERALVEALAALPDPTSRWVRMYADNEQTRDALLSDPSELGDDYSARAIFGAEADWEGVAAWSEGVLAGLTRKLSHVVVAGAGGTLGATMAAEAGLRGATLPPEGAEEALAALLEQPSDRLVLVLQNDAVLPLLTLLHAEAGLRDRVLVVLSVGGDITTSPEASAWMADNFVHDAMDTELNRQTAYASVQVVDPAQLGAAPDFSGQRWPVPPETATGRAPIAVVDLGVIVPAWLSADRRCVQLSRGLWVAVAAWLV
jgi:hypothetical protein